LFEQVGIEPEARFDANRRVPWADHHQLIQLAVEATGDVAFAVRAAAHMHPSHLGLLGYTWLASSTLRMAMLKGQRYLRLVTSQAVLELEETPDIFTVRHRFLITEPKHPAQSYGVLAMHVQMNRMLLGPRFTPLEARFADPAPPDLEPFEKHFRCKMVFGHPHLEYVIPASELDRPLARAHPELSQSTEEMIVRHLEDIEASDVVGRTRAALFELMPLGRVEAEDVARRLNMSVRTLRRRLDDEDVSFRALVKELRQEIATRMIRDPSLSLTEICYNLGFAEPSSLTRFFRNWTGMSPTQAREHVLAGESLAHG
jgi:AraC-like DNA-binding protein